MRAVSDRTYKLQSATKVLHRIIFVASMQILQLVFEFTKAAISLTVESTCYSAVVSDWNTIFDNVTFGLTNISCQPNLEEKMLRVYIAMTVEHSSDDHFQLNDS